MFDHRRRPPTRPPADRPAPGKGGPQASTATAESVSDLSLLDRRTLAIKMNTPGGETLLRGVGAYAIDPDLGAVLRVAVADEAGEWEMLFVQQQWTGRIEPGTAHGCDYLLSVG
jgi:hypothetical protein